MLEKVRIDKWLWSVWIFKIRIMVSIYVKNGCVKVNDKMVKFSY